MLTNLKGGENVRLNKFSLYTIASILVFVVASTSTAFALALGDRTLSINSRGADVRELQKELAALDYNVGSIDGIFGPMTRNAVIAFQRDNNVITTGNFGPLSMAALNSIRNTLDTYTVKPGDTLWLIAQSFDTTIPELLRVNDLANPNILLVGQALKVPKRSSSTILPPSTQGAIAIPWPQVHNAFARHSTATVIDVETGLSFTVRRYGGVNHADVEPLTLADRNIMFRIYGNQWSWNRRPVVVIINGQRIAGSMNGMPHAGQSIANNNFNGHFCIHFLNSRTHGTDIVDRNHQLAVQRAVGK